MLLLTGVTFGGSDANAAFDHLSPDEAEAMKYRAAKLLEIPRDKRIPLLVQEIKRLVTSRKTYLWNAEPAAFAKLLTKEKPALRETILRALPMALAEAVREHLPPSAAAPDKELKPGVLAVVRWKLEELLEQASAGAMWKFSDVLLLKPREIYTVVERQGVRALGIAFTAMPKEDREAAFAQLPPDLRNMAQRATEAAEKRALSGNDAQALLKLHGFEKNPLEGIRSAGVQRLARACMAQSPDFAARMQERHRPPFVTMFQKWVNDDRTKNAARGDGGRAEIVAEMERLEVKGLLEKPTRLPAMKPKPILPPPPPSAAARGSERASVQAPNIKPPIGRKPTPPSQKLPSVVIAPKPPSANNENAPRRDFIAEREARKAGVAGSSPKSVQQPSVPAQQFRDPIAERNARRAGVARTPSGEPPLAEAGPPPSARMHKPAPLRFKSEDDEIETSPERPSAAKKPPPAPPPKAPRSGHQVVAPLPQRAKNHPRGVGQLPDEQYAPTDPYKKPGGVPPSISQPVPDPSGSRMHKIKPLKENRIMKGDSKPMQAIPRKGDVEREPQILRTGSRPALNMKPLSRVKGDRPPPLPPGRKGPGRGPGGDKG